MNLIDPVYFRLVFSGIKNQSIDIFNYHSIPNGVASFFEDIFRDETDVKGKSKNIEKFIFLALLENGLDLNAISVVTAINKLEWTIFINKYAKFLRTNAQNQLSLFHQRFLIFILLRSNQNLIKGSVKIILNNIKFLSNENWQRENIGYYYFLNEDFDKLCNHLEANDKSQHYGWWVKDFVRLLDAIYLNKNISGINFTKLCELLRTSFDFLLQRKGVRVIVLNASKIDWDSLNRFFETTQFQYELAKEFSKNIERLPENWMDILQNEDHPLSYTFINVWKYYYFDSDHEPSQEFVNKLWNEGSPYLRIAVIIIWGYNKLNGKIIDWLESLMMQNMHWEFLIEEKINWESGIAAKLNCQYIEEFNILKSKLDIRFNYIFDNYWDLFYFSDRLNADVKYIWDKNYSLEIVLWIYRHPLWEIGKVANEILIYRLRSKLFRKETIEWLINNWEIQELFALGEVIFELKKIEEEEKFWFFAEKIVISKNSQLRGVFISDLITFLEYYNSKDLDQKVIKRLIPNMILNASDIWEIQELIRLCNYFLDNSITDKKTISQYLNKIDLLKHFEDPLLEDFNEVWRRAEKIKGLKK